MGLDGILIGYLTGLLNAEGPGRGLFTFYSLGCGSANLSGVNSLASAVTNTLAVKTPWYKAYLM